METQLLSRDTAYIEKIIGDTGQISYLLIYDITTPAQLGLGKA